MGNNTRELPVGKVKDKETKRAFNKELLNTIIGSKEQYIIIWNEYNEIEFVSSSFRELTDLNINDWIGHSWTKVIEEKVQAEIFNYMKFPIDELNINHLYLANSKKEEYIVTASLSNLSIDDKIYFLLKSQNISHKYMLENSIFNSHKFLLLNKLSAGIVHEIKNPLASIRGFVQLKQKGIKKHNDCYELILREIDRIEALANELLENSKPTRENNLSKHHVYTMIDEVAFLFTVQSKLNNIKLNISIDDEVYLICDRSKIKQVLINLIKNGIDSMDANGKLQIDGYYEDDYFVISIKDEGKGIDHSVIGQLNKPFYTTKPNGTGLGLMICQKIMQQHNGKMRISPSPFIGSNFEILLPK